MDHYVLDTDGRTPIKCDLMTWARSRENMRHVAKEDVGDVRISTVFLGLDHSWGNGPPLLFETMIFGGKHDSYCERCSTWEEAKVIHLQAVKMVKSFDDMRNWT